MSKVLIKSRESNTVKNYSSYFEKWRGWADQFPSVNVLPADEFYIALYILQLLQVGKTYPVIRMTFYAINYFHNIVGYRNPCPSSLVPNILEGIKRLTGYSVTKKAPITVAQLYKLYDHLVGKKAELQNLRTMLVCILSFMGFLRFSEVVKLRQCDFSIHQTHLVIFIEKSKTDVYREGSWVYLTKLDSVLCPIKLILKYFRISNIQDNCQKHIFRAITNTKKGSTLRKTDQHISYTRVMENVLEGLKNIGLDVQLFGLHSLRAGGATAAANLGVKDRLFKKHGRWKSEKVKGGYVHESIQAKLTVTKNLGL